jgi:hypothetical protein
MAASKARAGKRGPRVVIAWAPVLKGKIQACCIGEDRESSEMAGSMVGAERLIRVRITPLRTTRDKRK